MTPPSPDEIKAFRKAIGWSQPKLAEMLGAASGRTVEAWESGINTAPPMLRLALSALNAGLEPWASAPS
jgi:DNA-binding transcriptional regulator YiaG